MYRLSGIPDNRYYQYSLEHKNSDYNPDDDIYVIRNGQRINFSEIAILDV